MECHLLGFGEQGALICSEVEKRFDSCLIISEEDLIEDTVEVTRDFIETYFEGSNKIIRVGNLSETVVMLMPELSPDSVSTAVSVLVFPFSFQGNHSLRSALATIEKIKNGGAAILVVYADEFDSDPPLQAVDTLNLFATRVITAFRLFLNDLSQLRVGHLLISNSLISGHAKGEMKEVDLLTKELMFSFKYNGLKDINPVISILYILYRDELSVKALNDLVHRIDLKMGFRFEHVYFEKNVKLSTGVFITGILACTGFLDYHGILEEKIELQPNPEN